MAKIYGLFGAMKGKTADVVMAVRNGEQIVRKYQPMVYNPNTPGQVAARARLKLMSQLAAVMAPVIAIPRSGSVSSRNLFVKANYGLSSFNNDTAEITLARVQLTKSVVGLPVFSASVSGAGVVTAGLELTDTDIDAMVYVAFVKETDNKLRLAGSTMVSEAGDAGNYEGEISTYQPGKNLVVYAYGIRNNTEAARVAFGNMTAAPAETVAQLIATRQLSENDVTLTETRGLEISPA